MPMQAMMSRNTPHEMIPPITEMSTMYAVTLAYAATPMRTNATTYTRTHNRVRTTSISTGVR